MQGDDLADLVIVPAVVDVAGLAVGQGGLDDAGEDGPPRRVTGAGERSNQSPRIEFSSRLVAPSASLYASRCSVLRLSMMMPKLSASTNGMKK
ncbi:hypothetical protein ASF78_20275 [Cellulomonas sp. Leaf334]|nr:hypothetical protein ASF78_20275 [Cellulomonas sp. Leaf334]